MCWRPSCAASGSARTIPTSSATLPVAARRRAASCNRPSASVTSPRSTAERRRCSYRTRRRCCSASAPSSTFARRTVRSLLGALGGPRRARRRGLHRAVRPVGGRDRRRQRRRAHRQRSADPRPAEPTVIRPTARRACLRRRSPPGAGSSPLGRRVRGEVVHRAGRHRLHSRAPAARARRLVLLTLWGLAVAPFDRRPAVAAARSGPDRCDSRPR